MQTQFLQLQNRAVGGNPACAFPSFGSGRSVHLQTSVIKAMPSPQGGNCTTSE